MDRIVNTLKKYGICVVLAGLLAVISGCTTEAQNDAAALQHLRSNPEEAETWGIQPVSLRQTAAGNMLDFRYKVLDPEKAAPLFERAAKPYLLVPETGYRVFVPTPPKVGPLRTSNPPQAGKTYIIIFGNPNKRIEPGERVTVVIGDFEAKDLIVQ